MPRTVMITLGLSSVAAIAITVRCVIPGKSVVLYPGGPISSVTLPAYFQLQEPPEMPRCMVARSNDGREFQVLLVSSEGLDKQGGPLSRSHIEMVESEAPEYRDVVHVNGVAWNLEVNTGPLSQMLAIADLEGTRIGVIGRGDWTKETALEVLSGIAPRQVGR